MPDPADTVTVTPPIPEPQPASDPGAPPASPESQPDPAAGAGNPEPQPMQPEGAPFQSLLAEDGKQGESGKEGEPKDKPDESPEVTDFEIKLPDGFTPDESAVGFLKEKVKAGAMTGEQAQEMADQYMAADQRRREAEIAAGQKTIQGWHEEIKTNPEFGGAKFNESIEHGRLMLQKYGSPRLVNEFARMGVLDHPEFMYMLNRIHAEVSDGQSLGGSSEAIPEKRDADIIFGD